MRITVRRLITVLIAIAAVAGIAWSVMPRPIPVETATVTKGRFVATVDEDGKTRVRERYVVATPLAGRLTRIRLKAGDQVVADDAIAAIAPSPAPFLDPRSRREAEERLGAAEATIERTKAGVERAHAQADQASNDLARTRTLVERGVATIQAQERADLAMRVADRDLRAAQFLNHAAEHEFAQAKALLAQYDDGAKAPPEIWTRNGACAPAAAHPSRTGAERSQRLYRAHGLHFCYKANQGIEREHTDDCAAFLPLSEIECEPCRRGEQSNYKTSKLMDNDGKYADFPARADRI